MKTKRRKPEIVLRDGEPTTVILDIDHYEELLERLDDIGDLKSLRQMRSKPLTFRKLTDFLKERRVRV